MATTSRQSIQGAIILCFISYTTVVLGCNLEQFIDAQQHVDSRRNLAAKVAAEYDYDSFGPNAWPVRFPGCRGSEQSPIDIPNLDSFTDAINVDDKPKLEPLQLKYFPEFDNGLRPNVSELEASHNLFTISVSYQNHPSVVSSKNLAKLLKRDDKSNLKEELSATWVLEQFHLHWGKDDTEGSEHFRDGKPGALEVHFVHRNSKYETLETALLNSDGLMVIGRVFEVEEQNQDSSADDNENEQLQIIIDAIKKKEKFIQGSTTKLGKPLSGAKLLLDDDYASSRISDFFTYAGSLTTPNCNEVVSWILLHSIGKVSVNQLKALRSIKAGDTDAAPITRNWRAPLDLRGRTVYHSGSLMSVTSGTKYPPVNTVLEMSIVVLVLTCMCFTWRNLKEWMRERADKRVHSFGNKVQLLYLNSNAAQLDSVRHVTEDISRRTQSMNYPSFMFSEENDHYSDL